MNFNSSLITKLRILLKIMHGFTIFRDLGEEAGASGIRTKAGALYVFSDLAVLTGCFNRNLTAASSLSISWLNTRNSLPATLRGRVCESATCHSEEVPCFPGRLKNLIIPAVAFNP